LNNYLFHIKYTYIYIHIQGISHGINRPTNITLLRYSGDDVAREEQHSKTEQEKRKKKTQQKTKHFDVRGAWARYCNPSTIED
jgi:hypothetical protein